MKTILNLKGLSCAHCQKRVEDALNSIAGVKAQVDLAKQQATVTLSSAVDDAALRSAVVSIQEKKGLFGR